MFGRKLTPSPAASPLEQCVATSPPSSPITARATATITWEQNTINMDMTILEYITLNAQDRGTVPLPKIPMPQGLFGLGGPDNIQAVADAMSTPASFEQLTAYQTELTPAAYFMSPSPSSGFSLFTPGFIQGHDHIPQPDRYPRQY